jgi:amino-acid N-acetyltransferase
VRSISIRAAVTGEWEFIAGILERSGLEASDIDPVGTTFHIAAMQNMLVGCAGAEWHGNTAVVGPVAVLPEAREQGIASHLVRATLMRARASGCRYAVLFSLGSASYFSRHGFLLTPRSELPDDVRASKAYQRQEGLASLCMRCDLA